MEKPPPRVVGYVRVSTDEQAEEGVSLGDQRARIEGYCRSHGLELINVLSDDGYSGGNAERPGFVEACQILTFGLADGLVVAKLDRLTRRLADWLRLVDLHFGPDAPLPWRLISLGDPIDLRTASGRLMATILVAVSQWELETIRERTAAAVAHKRSRGERLGQVPYGWRAAPDGKGLEPEPSEQHVLGLVSRYRADGLSLADIGHALHRLGYPARGGKPWSKSTLSRLLKRPPCPPTVEPPTVTSSPTVSPA